MTDDGFLATRPANYWVQVFFGIAFVAGGVVAFVAGRNSTGGDAHTALGAAGAALCFLVAYGLLRRVHPPRLRGVELRVSPEQVTPGGELTVRVERTGRSRGTIQVGLVGTLVTEETFTDAQGRRQTRERNTTLRETWHDVAAGAPAAPLRFDVPEGTAPSRKDRGSRVFWRVVARRPGRLRFDRRVERVVIVRG